MQLCVTLNEMKWNEKNDRRGNERYMTKVIYQQEVLRRSDKIRWYGIKCRYQLGQVSAIWPLGSDSKCPFSFGSQGGNLLRFGGGSSTNDFYLSYHIFYFFGGIFFLIFLIFVFIYFYFLLNESRYFHWTFWFMVLNYP